MGLPLDCQPDRLHFRFCHHSLKLPESDGNLETQESSLPSVSQTSSPLDARL